MHLQDLFKPDPARLRRALCAIINFAKFREEKVGDTCLPTIGLGCNDVHIPALQGLLLRQLLPLTPIAQQKTCSMHSGDPGKACVQVC